MYIIKAYCNNCHGDTTWETVILQNFNEAFECQECGITSLELIKNNSCDNCGELAVGCLDNGLCPSCLKNKEFN